MDDEEGVCKIGLCRCWEALVCGSKPVCSANKSNANQVFVLCYEWQNTRRTHPLKKPAHTRDTEPQQNPVIYVNRMTTFLPWDFLEVSLDYLLHQEWQSAILENINSLNSALLSQHKNVCLNIKQWNLAWSLKHIKKKKKQDGNWSIIFDCSTAWLECHFS